MTVVAAVRTCVHVPGVSKHSHACEHHGATSSGWPAAPMGLPSSGSQRKIHCWHLCCTCLLPACWTNKATPQAAARELNNMPKHKHQSSNLALMLRLVQDGMLVKEQGGMGRHAVPACIIASWSRQHDPHCTLSMLLGSETSAAVGSPCISTLATGPGPPTSRTTASRPCCQMASMVSRASRCTAAALPVPPSLLLLPAALATASTPVGALYCRCSRVTTASLECRCRHGMVMGMGHGLIGSLLCQHGWVATS
jgi:hypothetical protein